MRSTTDKQDVRRPLSVGLLREHVATSHVPVLSHTHPSSEFRQKPGLWIPNGHRAMVGMEDYSIVSAAMIFRSFSLHY
jgi:hypothetical protein